MLDFFDGKPTTGALCWTDQNDYLIVPKSEFFDFVLITDESLLEIQRLLYIPTHKTRDFAVLLHSDSTALFAFPATDSNMDQYRRSKLYKARNVRLEHATMIEEATDKINRL